MGSTSTAAPGDSPVTFESLPPAWEPSPVVPRLPVGVALVSILIALLAVVMILGGMLFLLDQFGSNAVPSVFDLFPSVDYLGAGVLLGLGISLLAIATALWRQETWALWVTIVVVFATTVYLFFTNSITVLFVLLVLLFVYLLAVRRYFY